MINFIMLLIARRIDENGKIDIHILHEKYPILCKAGVNLVIFISRIFNEEHKVIKTINLSTEVPIVTTGIFPQIDLLDIMLKYGIPKDYYIEIIASNFVTHHNKEKVLVPIFPNEIFLDCDISIIEIIKEDMQLIQKIGESFELIGKLYHLGFTRIAEDLRNGLLRFEKRDIDGSIKFFRKVIEALQKLINQDIFESSNRMEAIKKYMTKAYHLISNFGEHAGTEASLNEAIFSKEIAVAATKYVIAKMME